MMKRKTGDFVNGAMLLERVNGQLWKMRCPCGNVFVAQPSDTKGLCRKCAMKKSGEARKKHGESPTASRNATRLYTIWLSMHTRCNNPQNHGYKEYGGRGIKVCREWDDYLAFKEWALNNGYTDELSIDRIDVNQGYSPENCRWATQSEQMRNTRKNHLLTYNGETKTMAEWAEAAGIAYGTLKRRINKYGFTVEEALTIIPKRGNNQGTRNTHH